MRTFFLAPLLLTLAACGADKPQEAAASRPGASSAEAPDGTASEDDAQELSQYVLTVEDVRKWTEATRNASKYVNKDEQKNDSDDDQSIDGLERQFSANPRVRAEIEKTGLEVRDYVIIMWTMLQASMAQYAIDQGVSPDSVGATTDVNPANLVFIREHQQEIAEMQKAMQGQ